MEHAAPGEAGKRASEGSASTSVNAFELFRINSDVLSRVTDAASNQRLVDAPASGYRSESDFPACGIGGRAPNIPASGLAELHLRVRRHRTLVDDHPVEAEAIPQLTESRGEERLLHRHEHVAPV